MEKREVELAAPLRSGTEAANSDLEEERTEGKADIFDCIIYIIICISIDVSHYYLLGIKKKRGTDFWAALAKRATWAGRVGLDIGPNCIHISSL